jgi:hypothetical protein
MNQKRKYVEARIETIQLSSKSQLMATSEVEPSTVSGNAHLVAMGSAGSLE